MADTLPPPRTWLFTLAIFTSSFLLFLVQPMMARMALPQLGGAPNVWNSAMLIYQALLLAGYAYAHGLAHLSLKRQAAIHGAGLVIAAFSLPLALAEVVPMAAGWEVVYVPWLFLLSIGPAFFVISAQAPLIQRWFAAHPKAGNPYPLFAASNLGSFAGLLAYPLVLEPVLPLTSQSVLWSAGFAVMAALIALLCLGRLRLGNKVVQAQVVHSGAPKPHWRTVGLWLALSAVPSGLMLSTTTYLTTDIMAMPLLWVVPLGLYLLSFSLAFATRRGLVNLIVLIAPVLLLIDGSIAIFTAGRADLVAAFASVILLFVASTALHTRLYNSRPDPSQLTYFYLIMAAGGAIGGIFAALIAPVVFDWTWEHPLLILAAAALLPLDYYMGLFDRLTPTQRGRKMTLGLGLVVVVAGCAWLYYDFSALELGRIIPLALLGLIMFYALVLAGRRWSYLLVTCALFAALGGVSQMGISLFGERERSYFGIYEADDSAAAGLRMLWHGTTIHGIQRSDPERAQEPISYYRPQSGVGQALDAAPRLFGDAARIGVVGLGAGTLACYRQPGQAWTFFEIDPEVLSFSQRGLFTFLDDCAPDARIEIGDARLALEDSADDAFDVLVVDAFSSDAIPQHLLTREALQIYFRTLADDGIVMFHISNRYIALQPVLARLAQDGGYAAMAFEDDPGDDDPALYYSVWVAMAQDPERLADLTVKPGWQPLPAPRGASWTDDYASILPHLKWWAVW